ncbi:hypothetical protein L9F63_009429, partial [Diploptera punctata]
TQAESRDSLELTAQGDQTKEAGTMNQISAVLGVLVAILAVASSIPMPDSGSCSSAYKAHPSDCNAFYQCVSGKDVAQRCGKGLHWNAKSNVCDWPDSAGCKSGGKTSGDDDGEGSDGSDSETVARAAVIQAPAKNQSQEVTAAAAAQRAMNVQKAARNQSVQQRILKILSSSLTPIHIGQNNCPKSSESGDSSESSGDSSTSEESVPGSKSSSESEEDDEGDDDDEDEGDDDDEDEGDDDEEDEGDDDEDEGDDDDEDEGDDDEEDEGDDDDEDEEDEGDDDDEEEEEEESESGDSSESSGDSSTSEESVPGSDSSSSESNECPESSKKPKCPAKDPKNSVFFPHSDPHWYFHCSNGVAYCQPCPSPLVWNSECDTCDWEGQNNCPKSSESGDSSESSGDSSTSEESVPGSDSSSESEE